MSTQNAIKKHAFGTTGMQVGAVGFGAAEIGFERATDQTVDALLGAALDMGINVIDTAAIPELSGLLGPFPSTPTLLREGTPPVE
jgi:hypothetical protein